MSEHTVSITFFEDRDLVLEDGSTLRLLGGDVIEGELRVTPRQDAYDLALTFGYRGARHRYAGRLDVRDLLFRNGEFVQDRWTDFEDRCGSLHAVLDGPTDITYGLPGGGTRSVRIDATDTSLWIMPRVSDVVIRCRYAEVSEDGDARPGRRTVYYVRAYHSVL